MWVFRSNTVSCSVGTTLTLWYAKKNIDEQVSKSVKNVANHVVIHFLNL